MKVQRCIIAFGVILGLAQLGLAQAPAGATGQCKDGTYTNQVSKKGACRGHKGVQTWFANGSAGAKASSTAGSSPASTHATTPAIAPASSQAATSHPHNQSTTNTQQAPGGGPGMVWVNTPSKVYHCPGSRYYGKTKDGKYETEAQAKADGNHPEHGKACAQ